MTTDLESKLLSKEKLLKVEAGDWIDVDTLVDSLKEHGYNATYKNIISDAAGFWAMIYIDGEEFGDVEGSDIGHMVRSWGNL